MVKLNIATLIKRFGVDATRTYLQKRFSKPENFWEFASIFAHLMPDDVPDFHRELAEELLRGGKYAAAAPRGFAKSTVVGLIFLGWVALNGKKWFVPYISDTFLQAKLIAGGLRAEIESNEILQFIYPNARSNRWGEEGFVVNGLEHDCFILPLGAGMKIRGIKYKSQRPDLVIIDDLENLEAVYSSERRDKLQKWFDYDLEPAMDRYNKNIIYIGTILHYSSLLKQVIDGAGKYVAWRRRLYKALKEDGSSLWEARFSADYLRSIRDDPTHPEFVGTIVFSQELQNEPQDDKDRIIKMAWLKTYTMREKYSTLVGDNDENRRWQWLNTLERVGGVDPAISEKETADYFSIYVFGFEKTTGNEYQLDLVHDRIPDPNTQVKRICDMIEEWKLTKLGIESVMYQKGLYNLVKVELQRRGIYTCTLTAVKTDKDKIRRARIHSSAFQSGFIHLLAEHPKHDIIRNEIEEFPLGAHDDAFDSLMLSRESRSTKKARVFGTNPLHNS